MIKGMSVKQAQAELMYRSQRAATALRLLLRSAISNAKQLKLNEEKLFISDIRVDQGPMIKRFLPRAMGRATPIQKKMSHVSIVLSESDSLRPVKFVVPEVVKKEKKEKKGKKKAGKGREADKKEGTTAMPQPRTDEKEMIMPKRDKPWTRFARRIFRRKSV